MRPPDKKQNKIGFSVKESRAKYTTGKMKGKVR